MSARETNGRDQGRNMRGAITPPNRYARPANPETLTLKDIPTILRPQQPSATVPRPKIIAPMPGEVPIASPTTTPNQKISKLDDQATVNDDDLARQRMALGFDDIPITSLDNDARTRSTRQLAYDWTKQIYHHSLAPERRQRVARFFKEREFLTWKDDLKWALKADRSDEADEPAKPAPVNTTADTPRRIIVPQRGAQFGASLRSQSKPQTLTPQAATPSPQSGTKSIDININFGSLPKLPKLNLPKIPNFVTIIRMAKSIKWDRRTQIVTGLVVVLMLFVLPHFIPGISGSKSSTTNSQSTDNNQVAEKPDYSTILPSGKTVDDLGGWQRVSPPGGNPVFAYTDKIGDTSISVSQQPLPDSFRSNTDTKIADLAKSYVATDKITADSTTVYVGTSGQGPQSAIFTKNNLLILIKSAAKVSDADWATYAKSLN